MFVSRPWQARGASGVPRTPSNRRTERTTQSLLWPKRCLVGFPVSTRGHGDLEGHGVLPALVTGFRVPCVVRLTAANVCGQTERRPPLPLAAISQASARRRQGMPVEPVQDRRRFPRVRLSCGHTWHAGQHACYVHDNRTGECVCKCGMRHLDQPPKAQHSAHPSHVGSRSQISPGPARMTRFENVIRLVSARSA